MGGGLVADAIVAFKHFRTECRQDRAAAPCAAGRGRNNRLGKRLIDAVEQQPRALVGHAHIARGGRDRAGIADAFEQLGLAGANASAGLENYADPQPRHAGIVPSEYGSFIGDYLSTPAHAPPSSTLQWCEFSIMPVSGFLCKRNIEM